MTRIPRILIVDDDRLARDILEAVLYPEGYELHFASSGSDALNRMQEVAPDLLLLDVMMPHMTGIELCQHLKKSTKFQHIPIILVTALDATEELVRGLNAGADEFISKPVNSHELRARVRSMLRIKAQYDKLQDTLQFRDSLSKLIVHDMRNPLAVILIYVQLLKRKEPLTPEQGKYFEFIHSEAQQLSNFLDDILMLAKFEDGPLVITCKEVDINKFIAEFEQQYRALVNSQEVNFELIQSVDRSITVQLDLNLFQRVMDNLVLNALKVSVPNSKITVRIEAKHQSSAQTTLPRLRINVIDEGIGIPPEDWERVFDKNAIIAMKQAGQNQVGLGLVFCRMVIEAHGGRIFVRNNPTQGATFTIEI
ncbi:MAG: hybrid sensor histidine kinase/response regulator [Chloroflexi bacterium]|nr:hybrid sensor histidine kinase/response regulator [Chloroflexota bacterium]